jgi:hypothetical protein
LEQTLSHKIICKNLILFYFILKKDKNCILFVFAKHSVTKHCVSVMGDEAMLGSLWILKESSVRQQKSSFLQAQKLLLDTHNSKHINNDFKAQKYAPPTECSMIAQA